MHKQKGPLTVGDLKAILDKLDDDIYVIWPLRGHGYCRADRGDTTYDVEVVHLLPEMRDDDPIDGRHYLVTEAQLANIPGRTSVGRGLLIT